MSQNHSINFIKALQSGISGHIKRNILILDNNSQLLEQIVQRDLLSWLIAAIILEIQEPNEKKHFIQISWIKKESESFHEKKKIANWIFAWQKIKDYVIQKCGLSFSQFPDLLREIIQNGSKIENNGIYSRSDIKFFGTKLIIPFKFGKRADSDEIITPTTLSSAYEAILLAFQRKSRQTGIFYSPLGEIDYTIFNGFAYWLEKKEDTVNQLGNFLRTPWKQSKITESESLTNLSPIYRQYLARLSQITILDPACGTGNFLIRVAEILCTLLEYYRIDYQSIPTKSKWICLIGIDIDSFALQLAQFQFWILHQKYPHIYFDFIPILGDFILNQDQFLRQIHSQIDLIFSNPPYIRPRDLAHPNSSNKIMNDKYRNSLVKSLQNLKIPVKSFDRNADYYIYFFYHSINLLSKNGILGFITSNSWMNVRFGYSFQQYLCENVEILQIADNKSRSFAEAEINTVITLFRQPGYLLLRQNLVQFVKWAIPYDKVLLQEENLPISPVSLERNDSSSISFHEFQNCRVVLVSQSLLHQFSTKITENPNKKSNSEEYNGFQWANYFFDAPPIFFSLLRNIGDKLLFLGDIADITRGITTNCNDFFILTQLGTNQFQNGFGDEVDIDSRYLVPFLTTPHQISQPILSPSKLKTYLFYTRKSKLELKSEGAISVLNYIRYGETKIFQAKKGTERGHQVKGVIALPSFQQRYLIDPDRWYCLDRSSSDWDLNQSSPIFIQKIYSAIYRMVICENNIICNNTFYSIHLRSPYNKYSNDIFCLLLGSLVMLSLELHGRTNFGGGALDTATFDIAKIIIPNPARISPTQWNHLRKIASPLMQRDFFPAKKEFTQSDRRELDHELSHIIGNLFSLDTLYNAILQIQSMRLQRAKTF